MKRKNKYLPLRSKKKHGLPDKDYGLHAIHNPD